jgi:hypothetical protein
LKEVAILGAFRADVFTVQIMDEILPAVQALERRAYTDTKRPSGKYFISLSGWGWGLKCLNPSDLAIDFLTIIMFSRATYIRN